MIEQKIFSIHKFKIMNKILTTNKKNVFLNIFCTDLQKLL
jgi:hypothetical protein